ncbi:MAG: beta-galactosidase GalA [Verrucomicrobiota bacterium]
MKTFLKLSAAFVVAVFVVSASAAAQTNDSPRERLLMDFGWKFHLGNSWGIAQNLAKAGTGSGPASTSFSDASWRTVNLPHDWAIELPFNPGADAGHGFKPLGPGFPQNSTGWYRRVFDLPAADAGRRLWLEFDGAFRDTTVFLNGWFVGRQDSGYGHFRYDITDVANYGGRNVLAVKVDASEFEGWFYEGAGIYRHVWLEKTAPLAIAPDGTFVYGEFANNTPGGSATVHVLTRLANYGTNIADATVSCEILGPDGTPAGSTRKSIHIGPRSPYEEQVEQTATVSSPILWSPETPRLYTLVTTVEAGGAVVDRTRTRFGLRTVGFDVEKGFLLNGKPYELKGTCNHQDHAGVGVALPDRLQYFRVARLKEMGCNAYRTSHNPPTPELLDACDELGMLVMDENRLLGSDVIHMNRLERLLRRDRNHPSVAIWSIANEEFTVQGTPAGARAAKTMQDFVRSLDPTRPVTYAAPVGNEFKGINEVIEVRGWNYHVGKDMDAYHAAHPSQPNVGTEQGSTVSTRGIYANDKERGYVSAYDDNAPAWAHTAETWWGYFATRPWLSGGFVWTGFDYRGEPTPYLWPCISSHFGILDTCGFPKDNFWYYQSWWTDAPVLHLLPHWNWQGQEGQEIDVRALSNCEEVEVFLNGQSQGKKAMERNSTLKWKIKYAPGTLSAKGYKSGQVVAQTKVETTGNAASVRLEPDRARIHADAQDVSVITVSVRDAQGRIVPVSNELIQFDLEGPGRILGVGNGDPSCHEPDVYIPKWPVHTQSITGWRSKQAEDPYRAEFPEMAAGLDDSAWVACNVQGTAGTLPERQHAFFRAHFQVTDADLASPVIEMSFGNITSDGWVYVNGKKVGESHDSQSPQVLDVKNALHAGDNVVGVVVANYGNPGGISKGVTLEFQDKPELPQWERSVFNGLAQVIVQSSRGLGSIRLTARADGLASGQTTIQSESCPLPPTVP